MNQQSRELVKEWVRYEGNKKSKTSKNDEVTGGPSRAPIRELGGSKRTRFDALPGA